MRKRTIVVDEVAEPGVGESSQEVPAAVPRILPLDLDLGRDDLNRIVAKVNEIVDLIK